MKQRREVLKINISGESGSGKSLILSSIKKHLTGKFGIVTIWSSEGDDWRDEAISIERIMTADPFDLNKGKDK